MGLSQPSLVSENGAGPRGQPTEAAVPARPLSVTRVRAEDRSHLLRRTPRSTLFDHDGQEDGIRLRRQRRVNASFSGIPALARDGLR